MNKTLKFYAGLLIAFGTFALFTSYTPEDTEPTKQASTQNDTASLPQVIHSPNLDQAFQFAGEALPMDNFDVKERLDRELTVNSYWHSSTVLNIKTAARFFPIIEKILEENGVPEDFKYLAVAESGLRNVSSPAGAKGVWQFVKNTGTYYGLEINSEVDERYHLEKATKAACEYIKGYKEQFGSWTLAAAAYNMGGPNLKKELGLQRAKSFYDLNLNAETNRYLFRIIAMKEILKTPQDFGFYLDEEDLYKPLEDFAVAEVTESISNLGDFAAKYGTTYRMIKLYNPWLRNSKLTNSKGKTYEIRVPK